MAAEPSNSDLAWRIDTLQRMVAELVGRPEYTARQESAEHRFADLASDVTRLDHRHDEDITKVNARIDGHEKSHADSGLSWRQIVWPMLGAFVASAAAIAVTLLTSGGH